MSSQGPASRHDTTLTPGKVFVGGLGIDTTEEEMKEYFGKFGEITDIVVMKDKMTGNGRGFGFVTFSDSAVADSVVASRHEIKGRSVEAKLAVPREADGPSSRSFVDPCMRVTKIFIGGLPPSVGEEDLREHFSIFGPVKETLVMVETRTQKSRGFGFVTFESYQSVEDALRNPNHMIRGRNVEVKKAFPKGQEPPGMLAKRGVWVDARYGAGMERGGGRDTGVFGGSGGGWGPGMDPMEARMMMQMYSMSYPSGGGGYVTPAAAAGPVGYTRMGATYGGFPASGGREYGGWSEYGEEEFAAAGQGAFAGNVNVGFGGVPGGAAGGYPGGAAVGYPGGAAGGFPGGTTGSFPGGTAGGYPSGPQGGFAANAAGGFAAGAAGGFAANAAGGFPAGGGGFGGGPAFPGGMPSANGYSNVGGAGPAGYGAVPAGAGYGGVAAVGYGGAESGYGVERRGGPAGGAARYHPYR